MSVLVVDDEPVLRELVTYVLQEKGFQVAQAECGDVAFAMVSAQSFDFVLSDVRMPNGNGVELLKRITQMQAPRPHIFLVSAYSEISRDEALKLGACDLLTKPVDYEKLCQAMKACLD